MRKRWKIVVRVGIAEGKGITTGIERDRADACVLNFASRKCYEKTSSMNCYKVFRHCIFVTPTSKFLNRILVEFFADTEPASNREKPACIKNTKEPAYIIQCWFTSNRRAAIRGSAVVASVMASVTAEAAEVFMIL